MDTSELAIFHGLEMSRKAWAYQPSLNHLGANGLIMGFHRRLRSSLLGQGCTRMFNRGRLLACKYRCAESRGRANNEHVAFALNDLAHLRHVVDSSLVCTLRGKSNPLIGDVLRQSFP
ncbi:hypothetical protein XAXN_11380 [Xanthomonas axonopodis]|uniref:Uncharacterized protein n=1 Tax=Xanthomonas axonopodis TaxID=53413 RepID=A0A0P6VR93_9XANT|nr:hypothetical protein XAXN_11380 [Xanthomonas axonopodis]